MIVLIKLKYLNRSVFLGVSIKYKKRSSKIRPLLWHDLATSFIFRYY